MCRRAGVGWTPSRSCDEGPYLRGKTFFAVLVGGGFQSLQNWLKQSKGINGCIFPHVAGTKTLELCPHAKDDSDFGKRNIADKCATPRCGNDQAIALQPQQGLSHRAPANFQFAGEILFNDPLPRPQRAGIYRLSQIRFYSLTRG